MMGEIVVRNM